MADRPPPSRYSVVERGGRLVVVDRDTGTTPLSAAERMAEHDRRMGNEPVRPAAPAAVRESAPLASPDSGGQPAPARLPASAIAAKVAEMNGKRPWSDTRRPPDAKPSMPARPRSEMRNAANAGGRKTIVTGKWWDAKGPRTIELGPKGQQEMTGTFTTLFFVVLIAAIVLLFIEPVVLFIAAFLTFRFGGKILGQIGAAVIDKAIATGS